MSDQAEREYAGELGLAPIVIVGVVGALAAVVFSVQWAFTVKVECNHTGLWLQDWAPPSGWEQVSVQGQASKYGRVATFAIPGSACRVTL